MYGPTHEQVSQENARAEIRHFFQANRGLGAQVYHSQILMMARYEAADPQGLVLEAIRLHQRRDALCGAILGPFGQLVLAGLGWEFPEWRPVLGIVPAAAQAYCAERDKSNATTALWTIAILGIAGVIAAAISGGKVKPT
jgi:hypothetical protein